MNEKTKVHRRIRRPNTLACACISSENGVKLHECALLSGDEGVRIGVAAFEDDLRTSFAQKMIQNPLSPYRRVGWRGTLVHHIVRASVSQVKTWEGLWHEVGDAMKYGKNACITHVYWMPSRCTICSAEIPPNHVALSETNFQENTGPQWKRL